MEWKEGGMGGGEGKSGGQTSHTLSAKGAIYASDGQRTNENKRVEHSSMITTNANIIPPWMGIYGGAQGGQPVTLVSAFLFLRR